MHSSIHQGAFHQLPVQGRGCLSWLVATRRLIAHSLDADEHIIDFDGSVESMQLIVQGPNGTYSIGESEIFATPRLGRRVSNLEGTRVYPLERAGARVRNTRRHQLF